LVEGDFKALMDGFILEIAKSIKEGCKGKRWKKEEVFRTTEDDVIFLLSSLERKSEGSPFLKIDETWDSSQPQDGKARVRTIHELSLQK
jgi:hypothetical protein